MSKNRGYREYSKPMDEAVTEENKEEVTEAIEEAATNTDIIEETNTTTDTIEEYITGTVTNCMSLNIRKEPKADGEIVCKVPVNTLLVITPSESTDEWLRVFSETGANGYCMKKYVTVKQ